MQKKKTNSKTNTLLQDWMLSLKEFKQPNKMAGLIKRRRTWICKIRTRTAIILKQFNELNSWTQWRAPRYLSPSKNNQNSWEHSWRSFFPSFSFPLFLCPIFPSFLGKTVYSIRSNEQYYSLPIVAQRSTISYSRPECCLLRHDWPMQSKALSNLR